jgi:phenylacetic acid degradation protein
MSCYSLEGVVPVVHPGAFVHPSAVLIGDVIVGAGSYVGPCASLRGDFGRIVLEAGVSVQDGCILHGYPGYATVVEDGGQIGHGAVLHSCIVRRNALIGMKAVVMDEAEVGEQAVVAACSFVPAGMRVAARTLVAGIPVKTKRQLTDEDLAWKLRGAQSYQKLVERCLADLREVQPLSELDASRPKLKAGIGRPLSGSRRS